MEIRYKMIAELVQHILTLEIDKQNYEFLKIAYDTLGLYDNKRLVDTKKKNYKKRGKLVDGVFEDVIAIIKEEIELQKNDDIIEKFVKYYEQRYPDIKKAIDKSNESFEQYKKGIKVKEGDYLRSTFSILCYAVYGKNIDTDLNNLLKGFEKAKDLGNLHFKTYEEDLEQLWEIENLKENKIYQRYLRKQREILTSYLGISPDSLESYMVQVSAVTIDKPEGIIDLFNGSTFLTVEESLFKILDKHKIPAEITVGKKNKRHQEIVRSNFENLCGALVYYKYRKYANEEQELKLSMIIRNVIMENPEAFFNTLVASFYFELVTIELENLLTEYYYNFSFDKFLGLNREKEYSVAKKDERVYIEKIEQLEKQIHKEQNEKELYIQKIKNQEQYIKLLEEPIEEVEIEDFDISFISNQKIAFIGGMQETIVKLRGIFANSVFIKDEGIKASKDMEIIVMFPKFMNHALYYKYIAVARENHIPVVYCNGNNVDMIKTSIYNQWRMKEREEVCL